MEGREGGRTVGFVWIVGGTGWRYGAEECLVVVDHRGGVEEEGGLGLGGLAVEDRWRVSTYT